MVIPTRTLHRSNNALLDAIHQCLRPVLKFQPYGLYYAGNNARSLTKRTPRLNHNDQLPTHWKIWPPTQSVYPPSIQLINNEIRINDRRVPPIWLRDNCQCTECVHSETKQRLVDTFLIPRNISIVNAADQVDYIEVDWSDGHHSRYERKFLQAAKSPNASYVRQGLTELKLWGANIARNPPRVSLSEKTPVYDILKNIRMYGFCYVDNVPTTPEATEAMLRDIAFIRETHYGGFYDFTADLASKDTAYTNIALPAHTDTTYFSDPIGLQAFHLLSHTNGDGGASLLVDGFKAAARLHAQDPTAYGILATYKVYAHASGNDGISIQPYTGFPVLEHHKYGGCILRVRWNSSDRASIGVPLDKTEKWYDAARQFNEILKEQESEYWEQLKPGTVLIFDNWRVLHGRSAFTGKRRICGGYINRDDWISKFKMLHFGEKEVLDKLIC